MADWVTIQPPRVPAAVVDVSDLMSSVVGALLAILDVVRSILNVIKPLMSGLLDPIAVLVGTILSEVEALLNDLQQAGVYIAFDETSPPFEDISGGYAAYERRMIKRLTDRSDLTRPAFTRDTGVIAVFLYVSADSTSIQAMLAALAALKNFFHVGQRSNPYPSPIGLTAQYGTAQSTTGMFGPVAEVFARGENPTVGVVQWQMAPTRASTTAWPLPPPHGFLIEVSTIPDGVALGYVTSPAQSGIGDTITGTVMGVDGEPFRLYGGNGIFDPSDLAWDVSRDTYTPPPLDTGKTRLFGFRSAADAVAIPPNMFGPDEQGRHIFQRTFYQDLSSIMGNALLTPGQPFTFKLRQEDLPYDATLEDAGDGRVRVRVGQQAREVYVRVSAVTKGVEANAANQASTFYWTLSQNSVVAGAETKSPVRLLVSTSDLASSKGGASDVLKMTYPTMNSSEYLDALTTALVVLVLARADLSDMGVSDVHYEMDVAGQTTGLEDVARYIVPQTLGLNTNRWFRKVTNNPVSFRTRLLKACRASANEMLQKSGILPTEMETSILSQAVVTTAQGTTKPLWLVTWKDLDPESEIDSTILDSLSNQNVEGTDTSKGVAPNPLSTGIDEHLMQNLIGTHIPLQRKPGFLLPEDVKDGSAPIGSGSADYSPVLYKPNSVQFCRNIFLANPTILTAAGRVLNIASAQLSYAQKPGEGEWKAYRLLPNGMPPVNAALGQILNSLQAIQDSTQSVADAIVVYLDFIDARIMDLEALLRRIDALLGLMTAIEVPATSGLVVVGQGTDGILTEFTQAGEKPQDTQPSFARITSSGRTVKSATYGAGFVLVAGGMPTTIVDLLQRLFVEEP